MGMAESDDLFRIGAKFAEVFKVNKNACTAGKLFYADCFSIFSLYNNSQFFRPESLMFDIIQTQCDKWIIQISLCKSTLNQLSFNGGCIINDTAYIFKHIISNCLFFIYIFGCNKAHLNESIGRAMAEMVSPA